LLAAAEGFGVCENAEVRLTPGQEYVFDVQLKVALTQENVTVSSEAALDTDSPSRSPLRLFCGVLAILFVWRLVMGRTEFENIIDKKDGVFYWLTILGMAWRSWACDPTHRSGIKLSSTLRESGFGASGCASGGAPLNPFVYHW
jgi:hypothetical protein